jgi:ABC-type multidrug transport system ATPase subunit
MARMKIELSGVGKRFNREWIFRNVSFSFQSGSSYAVTGANGSGKSTLLQTIGGMLQQSEGTITYTQNKPIVPEKVYQTISLCAPYIDLIEEMTLIEFLQFHRQFKPFLKPLDIKKIISIVGLEKSASKQIQHYSSGMKQRVKLAQAIFSDTEILLLDEPCSNLDLKGIELYHDLIQKYCANRLVIVCSNDQVEYSFSKEIIEMQSFKNNFAAPIAHHYK